MSIRSAFLQKAGSVLANGLVLLFMPDTMILPILMNGLILKQMNLHQNQLPGIMESLMEEILKIVRKFCTLGANM